MAYAVRDGRIPRNPADGVSPKGAAPVVRQAYTVEQVRALSRAAEGDRLGGVFALILLGLRRGEALGLRWEDVDLSGATLTVGRSRVWLKGGPVDNPPKTVRGERIVALDSVSVERLKAMRAVHAAERLALGVGLGQEDVLAATEDRSPLRPETLAAEWRALCELASKAEQEAERDLVPDLGLHAACYAQVKILRAAAEQAATAAIMARLLG